MGLKHTIKRLKQEAEGTQPSGPDPGRLRDVEDWLTAYDVACGELDEADIPAGELEASRRRDDEAVAILEDEWRRLEEGGGDVS